ncbi:XRE family transcriptional regulator [Burkholderia cenocepacia]|uniref:LexA family protein n=1 Tax=Burkholderia cenocepacia TaxID=95486 RepID=UPI00222EFF75|nr:XRE family transcriptional regulator [Burkholderia cenocepacia]MCW3521228.1 XRE family transcriptional regulator [Burkholderia cenocepacia]MCW3612379.1 XRE family transcriptional regulator [Burkholderia cenocepacia]MCW3650217.1 XRE family transcriptional regulator [Burkholderia cenocepacia]MCW3664246.1 XRE family transcriptional regulator [Burkholderia cenocepacia]MCW3678996.1 XRE family transcriptional regulator [Burkholderia cenocepacia]
MTEAEHIGTRIRALRLKRGLTLQEVANEFGISRASVSEWESGRSKPDATRLAKLSFILQTTVLYLLEGDTSVPTSTGPSFVDSAASRRRLRGGAKQSTDIVDNSESNITEWPVGKLPLISWVQAGDWSEIVDNFQPGDAEEWIACPFPSGRHGFVLRVVGDSMYNPGGDLSFREGDFISVNPDWEAKHRSLVIARHNGEKATFKQLLIDENDGPMLFALNPNWPKRYISLDKHTEIIGVVTGQWRPLV